MRRRMTRSVSGDPSRDGAAERFRGVLIGRFAMVPPVPCGLPSLPNSRARRAPARARPTTAAAAARRGPSRRGRSAAAGGDGGEQRRRLGGLRPRGVARRTGRWRRRPRAAVRPRPAARGARCAAARGSVPHSSQSKTSSTPPSSVLSRAAPAAAAAAAFAVVLAHPLAQLRREIRDDARVLRPLVVDRLAVVPRERRPPLVGARHVGRRLVCDRRHRHVDAGRRRRRARHHRRRRTRRRRGKVGAAAGGAPGSDLRSVGDSPRGDGAGAAAPAAAGKNTLYPHRTRRRQTFAAHCRRRRRPAPTRRRRPTRCRYFARIFAVSRSTDGPPRHQRRGRYPALLDRARLVGVEAAKACLYAAVLILASAAKNSTRF